MLIKIFIAFFTGWLLWRIYQTVLGYKDYLYYKKQGVVFAGDSWSFTRDMKALISTIQKYPCAFSWFRLFRLQFGEGPLPSVICLILMGKT